MTTSGTTNGAVRITVYFVEGDDDEAVVTKWCRLTSLDSLESGVARVLRSWEAIISRFVEFRKRRQHRINVYSKYRAPRGDVAIVVKYAQVRNFRGVLQFVKDKLCAAVRYDLHRHLGKFVIMFDCDATWRDCGKREEVSARFNCGGWDVCCSRGSQGEGRRSRCQVSCGGVDLSVVEVLAVVRRLEDLCGGDVGACAAVCNCIC